MTPTINSKKSTKASGRQTNNSLSSISENIFIENNQNSKSNNSKQSNNTSDSLSAKDKDKDKDKDAKKSKVLSTGGKTNAKTEKKSARGGNPTKGKQKASSSSVLTETEEVLQIGMHKVLEHVKNHKDAWPFMDPVEEDIAPRYYSIIRRPMDLLKMEERLDNGQYLTFTDFRNDFKLIVNNCRLYNGQNNEYTEMVNNLQHAFEKSTKKYFEQNSSDEDGDLEYPDLKTNVFREKSSAKNSITPKIKEIIGSKGLTSKSTIGGKKIANSPSTPEKSATNKEKPVEKRGRKRKQKFKDKRKTDKADKSEGPNGVSDNDEGNVHSDVSDIEKDDVLDDDEEELEIIPAKKSRKMEKIEKVVDDPKPEKVDKVAKNSKKLKKVIEKKSPKELIVKKSKRKLVGKDDKVSDIEPEPEVEQTKKKKKIKATENIKEETGKKSSLGQGNKKELKGPKDLKETKDSKEIKEPKSLKESKEESKDLKKSNKKRKTQEIIDTYEFSDQDDSPIKEKKFAKGKKLDKKINKPNTAKEKLSDKKAKNGKQKKKVGKKKAQTIENEEDDIGEDDDKKSQSSHSSSTSASPIKFTVDLHAKYSKSASNTSINKIGRSVSAESRISDKLARSPSPTLSQYSSNDDSNSTSVKDKFDLIKERRGRSTNNDDKWKQIVKNAEKIKDKNKSSATDGPKVQEKNQKLKETIEKLKQKNKQSKKLLNKLSDAKPSNVNKTDEKNAFDLLKESKPLKIKSKSKDDLAILEAESIGLDISNSKKSPNKKQKEKLSKVQKKSSKNAGNITNPNIEALELETEQTLKDINRWLEHTPRFSEFHSASNSPTRFNNLLDDFDTVTSKLDPADFRRPLPITNDSTPVTFVAEQPNKAAAIASPSTTQKSPHTKLLSDGLSSFATSKENKPKQTIQLTGIPPPPGPHKRDKEPKRKSLKEKISAMIPKRKEIHRTIERLQPGKTKGNLIGTITKPEEVSILGTSNTNKQKDAKSSAVPEVEDSGPKLSLGTVLNTAGFGLIQQHNFADNENTKDEDLLCDSASKDACSDDMELEEIVTSTEQLAREKERKEKEEKEKAAKKQQSPGDKSATPNLNAWLKAFGVPKKQKKSDEDDADKVKKTEKLGTTSESQTLNSLSKTNSPLASSEQSSSQIPAQRTRKASTGSTVSERSSYSQDPDSPRIGIDERICGSYPAPYPSPLGASPIMTSPKDDIQIKPTSPYPLPNGAIRVGFYQDTTTKSSPEKSCSPREQPAASPYSNYAQHLYVSTTTSGSSNSYSTMAYTSPAKVNQNAPLGFNNKNKTPSYFDQYKQPKSQDSDYNSSVGSNPNSPYQSQHSPYQSENSPYQQSQTSPYTQQPNSIQSNASSSQQINPNSPNSPYAAPNSPYQNQQLSPYQDVQQQHSPYANSSNQTATQDSAQTTASSTNYHSNPSSPLAYNQSDVHAQHLTNLPKTSPQAAVIHQQTNATHINSSMSALSPTPQPLDTKTASNPMQYNLQSSYTNHQHYVNLADPPAPSVINSSSSLQTDKPKPDEEQRDILNLDYQKQTNKPTLNNKASDHPLSISDPLNKPHGYDPVFEPMGFNKNYDISSTKAIEMFNRAATMSFSKTFPTPLSVGNKSENNDLTNLSNRTSSASLLNTYQHPSMHSNYSLYSLDNKATSHLGYNSHEIDVQAQQVQQSDPLGKHGLYGTDMSSAVSSVIPNDNRIKSNELNVSTIPSHRYDVPSYDPRNIIHPLIDDNMNGSNCYYPPKEHPSQSLYGKSVLPTQSQTSSAASLPQSNPYNMTRERQQQLPAPSPIQPQVTTEPKPKRTRKKKNTVEPTIPVSQPPVIVNNHQMIQQHNLGWNAIDANTHSNTVSQISSQQPSAAHSSLLNQSQHSLQPAPSQGFQSYTALKPSTQSNALVKGTPTSEATAISLKTNSIVPGSAFNFGPTTSGSLAGLYGENPSYLEDYRASANPYYLQTHRPTAQPDQSADANAVSTGPPPTSYVTTSRGASSPAPPTYHQFLPPHHPYTNSQFYQQYLRTEEYRQRMMFANQGLLPHGSPTGYPQPGYHPALGMHKPYGW